MRKRYAHSNSEEKPMGSMNPKVDWYFQKAKKWQEELEVLRILALDCELTEELKWGCPCYTLEQGNVVLIHTFKEYCAFLFFKGALLKDSKNILVQQTKNVQSARQIRFQSAQEIIEMQPVLKSYIAEAIAVEQSGLSVEFKKTEAFGIPEELQAQFDEIPELKTAFQALTPGRQRGYILHFSAPKQAKTRISRIEKSMQNIFSGKGLDDQ
jgi:uncharacterized protein YdeI (YjbR/CyaY-like superfamily)